ncbi:MAG: TRAP transporter small permease [Gammaproteobacteria bacterium]|nr:TRAP transporter small permease [Gammaproteobacteria bacterium]
MIKQLNVTLRSLQKYLTKSEIILASSALLLLLGLSLAQIIARNLFATGFPMADTISRHMVIYIAFFGAILATEDQRHIKIDVLAAWLSSPWKARLFRPLHLIGSIICYLFTLAAIDFWYDGWNYAAPGAEWIAAMNLIIPLGFGLLTLHFLLAAILGPKTKDSANLSDLNHQ